MWKPWKINHNYEMPVKPVTTKEQTSMMWDFLYNHLPERLTKQDDKILWQDRKINFILILVAILVACFGKMALS